jgi:uncharacterized membrane protein YfcA
MPQFTMFITFGLLVGLYSSVLGLGGGLLIVPLLVALGYDLKSASATSLAVLIPVAMSSVLRELPENRIEWQIVLLLAVGGIFGSFVGIALKNTLTSQTLQRAFTVVLIMVIFDTMRLKVGGIELTVKALVCKLTSGNGGC